MKVLWLDTETTGLNSEVHGIIQLATIIDIDGELKEKQTFLMKPSGRMAEQKALDINGYSREQIASFEPWENIYLKFIELLSKYVDKFDKEDKFILGGQNVGFDSNFVKSWFEYCNDKYWFSWGIYTKVVVF